MGYPKLLFDNRFADAIPVASTTAAGNYAAANIADMRAYTWHKPTGLPYTNRVNCGSAKAANFALVYGHDLFTQSATFEVRASTDNFVTSNVLIATVIPISNKPFLVEFGSASYQYWGYNITGPVGNAPSIAIALIGTAFIMPKFLTGGFDPMGKKSIQQTNYNENGHPLGKIIDFKQKSQTLLFNGVLWSWLRSTWDSAWDKSIAGSPIIIAWDSVNYPAEIQLGTVSDEYAAPHQPGGIADLSFGFSGVAT